jgi:hypothetical protein
MMEQPMLSERKRMKASRQRQLPALVAVTAVAALLASPLAAGAAAAPHQDLHGTWRLNDDLTARMMENERQANPAARGGPTTVTRRGKGPEGPGGPGHFGGFEDDGIERPDRPAPSFAGLNEVKIEQSADKVVLTDSTGRQRTFWTDNRKSTDPQAPGGPAEVRAKWDDDGSLVVQITPKGNEPRRTEIWLVSNDRKLLYLTVEIEGNRRAGSRIQRAYNAAGAGASPAGEPKKADPAAPPPPPPSQRRW